MLSTYFEVMVVAVVVVVVFVFEVVVVVGGDECLVGGCLLLSLWRSRWFW